MAFCDSTPNIDYLAMYSRPSEYSKHENTALCFYQYDKTYDGLNGLYNAIFYNKKPLLKQYKKRFKDIKIAIDPDYSIGQNFPKAENIYRMYKSRIVGLWLKYECGITVIPNLTYVDESYFPFMLKEQIQRKLKKEKTPDQIAEELEESVEVIEKIIKEMQ